MAAVQRTGRRALFEKLGRRAAEVVAVIRYGTPMAVSARWRESMDAEAAARSKHRSTRAYSAERARLVHDALIAGRGR